MKLIIGLGNPGAQYAGSRHNIGFRVIDLLSQRHGIALGRKRLRAIHGKGEIDGEPVLLVQPQTFMNDSGDAVRRLAGFYQVSSAQDILLIYDDLSLDLGVLRLRRGGSDGGHRGVRSVLAHLGTPEVPRVRIGIGSPPPGVDAVDYVLSAFKASETKQVAEIVTTAAEATEFYLAEGIEAAMNRFNK
jgi:peptidyl-tRNA hydrolase, PTH1 family